MESIDDQRDDTFEDAFQCRQKLEEVELSMKLRNITFNEKVKYVYAYFNEQNAWEESCYRSTTTKSTETSINLREAGNEFYRDGRHKDALRLYTESVAVAFPDSVELSLAFANRSATLYRLGNYLVCLQDVNRSLSQKKCPESVRRKLLKRKEACLVQIEAENRRTKSSLSRDFQHSTSEDESIDFVKRRLQTVELNHNETEPSDRLCSLPVIENQNNFLSNINAKAALQFNATYGHHFVACEDIQPGEIIAHEKAFSAALDRNFRFTNCSHCFVKCDALLPCEGCSLVLFCGQNCRIEAYTSYHRVECEIAAFLREADGEFPYHYFLPLRTLLIGSEQGQKMKQLMQDQRLLSALENEWPLRVDEKTQPDYVAACNLYRDVVGLPGLTQLGFCMKSCCFLHWLKHSSFFSNEYSSDLTDEQAFAGTLLLNHFITLVFNAFSVTETVIPVKENKTAANYTIGTCLYTFCSRFNHSCDPNADFYSNKDSLVIYSQRPIAAGEQVFISYETHYHSVPRSDRLTSLNQYGFVCQCRACEGNWPLYDDLPRKPTLLRNLNHTKNAMVKLCDRYEKLWSRSDGDTGLKASEELLRFLCEFSTVIDANFQAPSQLQIACQNTIEKLFSTRGNFYVDCHDTENYVILLDEYLSTRTNTDRLRAWIREFLMSDVSRES